MTVFVDLIMVVAVGMAMAGMVFMKRMVYLQLDSIHTIRDVEMKKQGVIDQLPKENLVKVRIDALRIARELM